MASLSRPFLIPVTALFVTRVFAAPTEPLVDGDHFRYLEREELGPFPQDLDPKLSPGGAQFRSKLTAVLRRAVPSVPDNKSSGLSTGLIVLIVFASVFGAIIVLGCTSLVLVRRARSSTKTSASRSPTMSRSATMLSGSTLVSPSGTMDGRTLMQILADSGLPVPRHAVSNKGQEKLRADEPKSPVPAVLRNTFGFRAGASRRLSTSSHIVIIDQKSATAAGAVFLEEKPKVPPVLAVPRFASSSDAYGAEHVSPDYETPLSAAYQSVSAGLIHPPAPSRQQTMQSICSTVSNDSIPPCPPASPSADVPHGPVSTALLLPHTSCAPTESTSISHIAPKPAKVTPAGTLRVVNIKPKPDHRAGTNGLARTVVQRNMLHLAHSSRTHVTAEPVQHPFAASAVMSNGLAIHAPRPETLLRPPTLRVNTTGLHGQGM